MFSSTSTKIFLVCGLLCCSACSFWQSKPDAAPAPSVAEELKSEIPFTTKEPDIFQTEIVITADGGLEEKIFVAKNGSNRLIVFGYQKTHETAFLQIGENQKFTIARSRKIYAENQAGIVGAESETLSDFLTAELQNRKTGAKFETLASENDLARYRVNLDDAQKSEIIIYVDENIGLPVRQEFYSAEGEQKKMTLTVELKNFGLQTNPSFFEVPKDYRKVSLKELHEILRREPMK
jgi:hypothetical protein